MEVKNQIPYTQPTAVKDWNEEFQSILQVGDRLKYRKLANLSHDFVNVARTYGELVSATFLFGVTCSDRLTLAQIISEMCLPVQDKTIKPVHIGGIAGGDKYVCQGILFKVQCKLSFA